MSSDFFIFIISNLCKCSKNAKKKTPKQIQLKVDAIAITNVFITKYAQNFHQSLVPQRTKKKNIDCKIQPSVPMTRTRPKTHLKFLQTFIILREDNYEKKKILLQQQ